MIPILDLMNGSESEISKELVHSLASVGFVYLKNHGIPDRMFDDCMNASKGFFAQDLAFKESFRDFDDYKYVGYKGFESERLNPQRKAFDMHEAMLYDWHDIPSNPWPDQESESTTVALMEEMGMLAARVLKMIGVGLDLKNPDMFYETHTSFHPKIPEGSKSLTSFKVNRYPKVDASQLKEDQVLCGEHADFGTLTLLKQDHVGGLEVAY